MHRIISFYILSKSTVDLLDAETGHNTSEASAIMRSNLLFCFTPPFVVRGGKNNFPHSSPPFSICTVLLCGTKLTSLGTGVILWFSLQNSIEEFLWNSKNEIIKRTGLSDQKRLMRISQLLKLESGIHLNSAHTWSNVCGATKWMPHCHSICRCRNFCLRLEQFSHSSRKMPRQRN